MNAADLLTAIKQSQDRETSFPPHESPQATEEGIITNPDRVLLHPGSGEVRIGKDFDDNSIVGGIVNPKDGEGISVSVLDIEPTQDDLRLAHNGVIASCHGRLRSQANTNCQRSTAPTQTRLKK